MTLEQEVTKFPELRHLAKSKRYTSLASFLQERMIVCGYVTGTALAKAAGITQTSLSLYMRGRAFPVQKNIEKLATALQVNVQDIEMVREGDTEYLVTGGELESLINARVAEQIRDNVERIIIPLQEQYRTITKKLGDISSEARALRIRYDALVDIHSKALNKLLD